MIGQIVAATAPDGHIDESAKGVGGVLPAWRCVSDMYIEYHASPVLSRPGEKTVLVALDQPDRAIDDLGLALAEIRARFRHKVGQFGAWHVDLGDHLRAPILGAKPNVER